MDAIQLSTPGGTLMMLIGVLTIMASQLFLGAPVTAMCHSTTISSDGTWWSSTEYSWASGSRYLNYGSDYFSEADYDKQNGISVRCFRDNGL